MALPANLRLRADCIGLGFGLVAFGIAFLGLHSILPFLSGPRGVVLPIILESFFAATAASALTGRDRNSMAAGSGVRDGFRAGVVAALVGGALTVLAAALHAVGVGHAVNGASWPTMLAFIFPLSRPGQILIVSLLGLPPSFFFGMVGALLVAINQNPAQPATAPTKDIQPPASRWRHVVLALLIVTCAVGYLSPLAVSFFVKPPVVPRIIAPVPEPKWHYQTPIGFADAATNRVVIMTQRSFGLVAQHLPFAISPNQHLFAYCRDNSAIVVVDLDSMDVVATGTPPQTPGQFAWSPNSQMLLIQTAGSGRSLSVLDVPRSRLLLLPLPREERQPNGIPVWWDEWEALFAIGDASAQAFDFLRLRLGPLASSKKGKVLEKEDIAQLRVFPSHLPVTSFWKTQIESKVLRYAVPGVPSDSWSVKDTMNVALADSAKTYRNFLNGLDVDVGDIFAGVKDGTRLIRIRNNQGIIYFLGLRGQHATRYRGAVRELPAGVSADVITDKTAAFICPPLVNPLNGKTVGANRNSVKAIARVLSSNNGTVEVSIEEEYAPVAVGDVISGFHSWAERKPRGIFELGEDEVYAVIDSAVEGSAPLSTDLPPLDHSTAPSMRITYGGDEVIAIQPQRISKQSDRLRLPPPVEKPAEPPIEVPPSAPPAPPSALPAQPIAPSAPPSVVPSEAPEVVVRRFIIDHLDKGSRGDWKEYVSDYSDPVDFFDHGLQSRISVLRRVTDVAKQIGLQKTTAKSIVITKRSATTFEARCTQHFISVQSGKPTPVVADYVYTIELTPNGPQYRKLRKLGD